MSTIEIIGSPADYLAAVAAHWTTLGLGTAIVDELAAQAETAHGTTRWAEVRTEAGGYIVLGTLDGLGNPLTDVAVPDAELSLWQVPLASPNTIEHMAARGTLTLPAVGGVAIVRARTPKVQIGGHPKPPVNDDEPDAPVGADWEQRTPGLANGYMQGEMARRADKIWTQPLDLPESAPGALNGGSYADPAAPASGWITQFTDAKPTWTAGDVYTQPITVRHLSPSDGLVHLYQLQVASETALVGREPHQAYMWAVWLDLGVAALYADQGPIPA